MGTKLKIPRIKKMPLLLVVLVPFMLVIANVQPPKVSAALSVKQQTAKAHDFCDKEYSKKATACVTGFLAGYQGIDCSSDPGSVFPQPNDPCGDCKSSSGLLQGMCMDGYAHGLALANKEPSSGGGGNGSSGGGNGGSNSENTSKAEKYCKDQPNIKNNGLAESACEKGYKAGLNGGSNPCSTLPNIAQGFCNDAYNKAAGNTTSDSSSNDEQSTVENKCDADINPLTWIVCPVVDGINAAVKTLDGIINDLASIGDTGTSPEPSRIFCDANTPEEDKSSCKAYHAAWASFRNISLGFIVIVTLVIVIAQAVGSDLLDAYTIRKMLPRVVVAAIGITLSWEIMQFCVAVSNALGFGIKFLIQEPFIQAGFTEAELGGSSATAVGLISLGAVAVFSLFGMLSFAITGLIAVLVACLVLVLRQMLIIMLAILAPIALVAYILPNTQRLYKLWSDSFIKALLMFPMIVAFISIGRVFSAVATSGNSVGLVGQVIGFAAYFAPYFLIPLTFRFAGGAMSAIGGAVHQRSQGLQQGLSSFRTNQRKQRMANAGERIQTGNAFKRAPTGSIRHRLNRGLQGAALASKAGPNPANWRTNMRTAMNDDSEAGLEKFMSENAGFKIWGNDDAKLHAARFDNREQMAAELIRRDADRFGGEGNRAAREEAISQIERTKRQVNNETFHKARIRQQAKTGTGYQDANGDFDASAMLEDINSVYGGDRNGAGKALGEMRSSLTQSGQVAGVAGYGTWASQLENTFRHNDAATRRSAHMAIMNDAIDSASPSQAIYGKPSSARAMAQAHAHRIQTIARQVNEGNATQEDLSAAVASAAGLYDAMGQAAPGNASEFANVLMGQEVGTPLLGPNGEVAANNGTVRQYVEAQMLGNEAFKNRRRDLSQATLAGAAAEAAARTRITPGTGGPPTPPSGGPPPTPFG